MHTRRWAGLAVLVLICAGGVQAAQTELKVRAFPDKIHIGDEVRLIVQIDDAESVGIGSASGAEALAPFELKRIEKMPAKKDASETSGTWSLVLTTFKTGDLKIPPIRLTAKTHSGASEDLVTPEVAIKVLKLIKRPEDAKDIRPIKGPVSFGRQLLQWLLVAAAVIILIAGWIAWRLWLGKKRIRDLESLKPPHERAALELERLQKKQWLESGKIKEYYSELADILRRYLERQTAIQAQELTSTEILQQLKNGPHASEVLSPARELLETADLVKFAKFLPPRPKADELSAGLLRIVEAMRPKSDPVNNVKSKAAR